MENENRIIILDTGVNEESSLSVIAQLLYFNSENNKEPIYLYINSGGGSIDHGLAIYDTMKHIEAPVYTVCVGMCASMAAFLLSCGEKGHRAALKNSRILVHQPLNRSDSDYLLSETKLRINANDLLKLRDVLELIMAENANQPIEAMNKACERDNWMTAEEALAFGLIDEII